MTPKFTILGIILVLSWTQPATAREIVIHAVGDIMLAGSATPICKKLGYDYPFAATTTELKKGDIAIGNLEGPVARKGTEYTTKRFRFRAAPQSAEALRRAGFSVVTLANNHSMDFGRPALRETLFNLASNGILHVGAGEDLAVARKEAVLQVGTVKIAFLAYSLTLPTEFYATVDRPGTAPGYPGYFKQDIARAKASADYVLVSFHWGSEGAASPSPYQVAAAHAAIDAGADVILGHHPHVLQGIERYKKGVILYSLGNFAFGSYSRTASRSLIARITLDDGIKGLELIPLNVQNREVRFQPRPLKGKERETAMDRLRRACREMGTVIENDGERFMVRMEPGQRLAARQGRKYDASVVRGD